MGQCPPDRTFLPSIARPTPRFSQVVVLAVPPFWLTMAIVVAFFEISITPCITQVVIGLVLVGELHSGRCVVQRSEQILFHVPNRAAVLCKALQHKADVVGVQLHKPTAYHLGGLIVPGDVQHLAFGGTGVHQQIYDLIDGILIVRAEPEQKVYLQRLTKNILPVGRVCSSSRFHRNR